MDVWVFVIIILLGCPLFFFWRWVFRKSGTVLRRRILIWLTTIISAPVLYVVVIIGWLVVVQYYPNRDFDQKAWKTDTDSRYEYSHDLIESDLLIGKTKKQVMQILGNDTDTSQTNELYYYIGYRPELTGIDPSNIVVEFKNGKVNRVIEHDR